ncbi:uncharacterized protein buc2l isoform X2 [Paralichthys olivaceus]|uniref:uncharacterized protein buc2l isoform X2 n=1 Tax=Paralichthys olivaceus TaxID=8255 RepID=UPI003750A649
MDAATSTLHHSFGLGPRGPMPPRAEEQHHKPFFYIQPSQPYMSMQGLQWPVPMPMPMSYNPYYGYPGLGYGMPMMPHYQPNPYMEPPGFVVPHTHLHLMDYRRLLNPQYYQTMAYHSRRFRYQQNGPTREMTSSQVQTEPLSAAQRSSTPASSDASAASVCSSNSPNQMISPVKNVLELEDPSPSSQTRTPPNGSFVIQTEEVRIECCTTPVGLQLLHARETAEVSHRFSQDVVQRSAILQGGVLQDDGLRLPADQSEQALQACPDILLVGGGEDISALEESRDPTDPVAEVSNVGSQVATHGDVEETKREEDLSNFRFNIVHLPFDPKYLDELRKMESTVWSVEETLIPSADSLIQNGCTDSHEETPAAVTEVLSVDVPTLKEEAPAEEVTMIEMPPLAEDELEDMVPAAESPVDEMASAAEICPIMDVAEDAPILKLMHTAEVDLAGNLLGNSPLKRVRNQHRRETDVQDHQDTSFESLPAYLPSSSWLADFDNVYYCSKMPPTPKKQSKPANSCGLDVPTTRRKLELEYKEQHNVRKPKERFKLKGKVDRRSLSDHECCLRRNFNENALASYAPKRERLCSRCSAKRSICTSASPGLDGGRNLKRKAGPLQQWNEAPIPTCEACKFHTKKPVTKSSSPDVRGLHQGLDTEGESSENSSCRRGSKWRPADDRRKPADFKRPLASKQNQEKCPAAAYPKLREKNCVCNELQHQPVAWERLRHCHHGNDIPEMDENCVMPASVQDKWRNVDQVYWTHRWQSEKSWKAMMPDVDGSKKEARSQHLNKHKKSQSQGTRRKDTRC